MHLKQIFESVGCDVYEYFIAKQTDACTPKEIENWELTPLVDSKSRYLQRV